MSILDVFLRRKPSCKQLERLAIQGLNNAVLNLNIAIHNATMKPIKVVAHNDKPKRVKPV